MRRGGMLIVALWLIAVLSVMVLSFATEAHMQTGINVYVRERNRVKRLVEAGRILGEVVLVGYGDAKEPELNNGVPDWDEIFEEEDRWCKEKYELKTCSKCTIGPILLDEENPDSGTVKVELSLANSGERNGININELFKGGDQNYELRWRMILRNCGIDEELEVKDPTDNKTVNLMNLLIASWNDWRDEDDTVTAIEGDELGAESKWYEERDEEDKVDEEDRWRPRNGSIPDIQELSHVRGFREFPAVLTGGLVYPKEEESEDNPRLTGIVSIFGTSGSAQVNVNDCTVEQLLTVPGIFDEEAADLDDNEDALELAKAIVDGLKIMPDGDDIDPTREWWPYKDWQDLNTRLEDNATSLNLKLGEEASQYLCYGAGENTVFKMRIIGESMGMKHEVECECYVKEKKVRYIRWRED